MRKINIRVIVIIFYDWRARALLRAISKKSTDGRKILTSVRSEELVIEIVFCFREIVKLFFFFFSENEGKVDVAHVFLSGTN